MQRVNIHKVFVREHENQKRSLAESFILTFMQALMAYQLLGAFYKITFLFFSRCFVFFESYKFCTFFVCLFVCVVDNFVTLLVIVCMYIFKPVLK